MSVLDRVVVDVVHVSLQIIWIADQMLPVATLPDPTLALQVTRQLDHFRFWQLPGEGSLDQIPAQWVVAVSAG
jgi:hypothetical protein